MNKEKLRGIVFAKYRTIKEFSDAIGWQRNKSARILNGDQEPNSDDMRDVIVLFQLTPEEFIGIFFTEQFTKCTISEAV